MKSLLSQKIKVPFEIVISDDRSTDGTWEAIEQYQSQFQEPIQNGEYWIPQVVGTKCNSNECNPLNVSERCGWNKLNVYLHARGKYCVNIDADDYLKSDDIYQKQIEMLEAHPECSMCMQEVYQIKDGDDIANGFVWPVYGRLNCNEIISSRKFILEQYRAVNPCYMMRRDSITDLKNTYGKHFDDTVITFHHLQQGDCIYLDRADYVWVRYSSSITGKLKKDDELTGYALLPLHHVYYVPKFAGIFIQEGLTTLIHFFKELQKKNFKLELTDRTILSLQNTDGYIYKVLLKQNKNIFDKCKLMYIRGVLLIAKRFNLHIEKYIYTLLTNKTRTKKVPKQYWVSYE
jgi:glycosyltransferase involved in cell wall biosynthesis